MSNASKKNYLVRIMNCGQKATIIKFNTPTNIDIRLDNGIIIKNIDYDSFMKGTLAVPK